MNKRVLPFPSYCSTKANESAENCFLERLSALFILADEWLSMLSFKRGERAGDVTKILITLKLKYPITLTEKHF
jgi:hypothetical protein